MELTYSQLLRNVLRREDLSQDQAHWAFGQIMDGAWSESQIAGLLVALIAKGESAQEIAGAALAMREHVVPIRTNGFDVIDTCGTGGTGVSTFNVSTAAAMVCAGAGVHVAKHGNRTATRASGSADVLAALGVKIDAEPAVVEQCLAQAGVCFCFAVRCHPAMKFAAPVRKSLGVRTMFNVLGPLTKPAGAKRQLMGVFDPNIVEKIAAVLGALGSQRAMVVHSDDGLDELSISAPTRIAQWKDGKVTTGTLTPEELGLPRAKLSDVLVTTAQESAEAIRGVLAGEKGPRRDIVVLNAAAALMVADAAADMRQGIALAQQSIDGDAARAALEKLVAISNA